ncbi:hypothetical protein ISX56_29360, partial [Serratia ureilytica]|nr:hypothetical protein [Serratia ureilytica]
MALTSNVTSVEQLQQAIQGTLNDRVAISDSRTYYAGSSEGLGQVLLWFGLLFSLLARLWVGVEGRRQRLQPGLRAVHGDAHQEDEGAQQYDLFILGGHRHDQQGGDDKSRSRLLLCAFQRSINQPATRMPSVP